MKAQDLPTQTYVMQNCPACGSVHLVNPRTGKQMSEETPRTPSKPQ
jgi:predicted RNA-binding Zn-ribbon protein involved in translation (DUF1610 family)